MDFLVNINELCRICTCKSDVRDSVPIFDDQLELRDTIHHKISCCLPITVDRDDSLPKIVCNACADQLDAFCKFRDFSVKSELYLQNLLKSRTQNVTSIITSSNLNDESVLDTSVSEFCQIVEFQPQFLNVDKAPECKPSSSSVTNDVKTEGLGDLSPDEAEAHRQEFLRRLSSLYSPRNKVNSSSILKQSKKNVSTPAHNTRSVLKSTSQEIKLEPVETPKPQIEEEVKVVIPNTRRNNRSLLCSKNEHNTSEQVDKLPSIAMLQCDHCKELFPNRKVFIGHIRSAHQRKYKCNKCEDNFKTRLQLKNHNKKHIQKLKRERLAERKNKKCNVCGKEYLHHKDLVLHERSHTGEKPFQCTYCEKCFSSTSARNKHIQVHEKRWSHVCSYCGKGFVDKIHFVYHVQKHHTGERPFPCNQCDKKFVRKHDLLMHEANMHSTEPRQCYKCEICSKTFTNKSYLKTHTQNHVIPIESRKKFKCNICESVFCSKRNSIQHMLTHTGELPYECDLCKKRFNNKHGLEIHLLIHSGLKKFVCEVCGKAFALQNTLICHRRTHTGERPYRCDICDQRFTQKSSLNAHRKRHVKDNLT